MSTEKESSSSSTAKRKLSCTACFNALWFCYSPVHQMQQYYRVGVFDNCSGKWKAMIDCLTLKTKPASHVQVRSYFLPINGYACNNGIILCIVGFKCNLYFFDANRRRFGLGFASFFRDTGLNTTAVRVTSRSLILRKIAIKCD